MSPYDPMCWASYCRNGCYHGPLLCGTPKPGPEHRNPSTQETEPTEESA